MWGNSHSLMSQIESSSVTFMILPNGRTFRPHWSHSQLYICYEPYSGLFSLYAPYSSFLWAQGGPCLYNSTSHRHFSKLYLFSQKCTKHWVFIHTHTPCAHLHMAIHYTLLHIYTQQHRLSSRCRPRASYFIRHYGGDEARIKRLNWSRQWLPLAQQHINCDNPWLSYTRTGSLLIIMTTHSVCTLLLT